ncbi:MAG: hypothetical protein ACRDGM_06900 [bacterium]
MRRLVESWIKAEREQHGHSLAAAIRALNGALKTRLTHSRVAEWRRGKYAPSQAALSYILGRTLSWALRQAGIAVSSTQYQGLEDALWVSFEKDGEPYVELL